MHRQNHRWTDDSYSHTKGERASQAPKASWWIQPDDAQFKEAQQKELDRMRRTPAVMKHREGT